MSVIRFEHVYKSFGERVVFKDFNLDVQSGETKVVLGKGGSGKTTLLRMVLGLIKPDSGRVFVGDKEITSLSELELMDIRKTIGIIFQEGALFDSLTVGENVSYRMRESATYEEKDIDDTVHRLLGFIGLENAIDKFPSELSGGMIQRVGIARALVENPPILLYDAPTAGLDPITSRTICELIMKLRDLEDVSSIVVTHDLHMAITLARESADLQADREVVFRTDNDKDFRPSNTRFVMLKDGATVFEGNNEMLQNSEDSYIQDFLSWTFYPDEGSNGEVNQ